MRVLTVGNSFPPQDFGGGYEAVWEGAVSFIEERGHAVRVLTVDRVHKPGLAEIADARRELRWYWHDHGFRRGLSASRWRSSGTTSRC